MNDQDQLGIGIAGCGMIAHFHARAIRAMPGASLRAVYGRDPSKAAAFADQHGCAAFSEYGEMLARAPIDAVAVATPSGAHLEPTVRAAAAGKHVICEKPLEVTLERVDEMIDTCERHGVVLCAIFPRRFNEATEVFKQAVDAGRFGRIVMADAYVKWHRTQDYYDSGAWRGTWALDGGGALANQSIHTIDLLLHLAGDVASVCAFAGRAAHARIEVEDVAVAILEFRNGARGVIQGSTACYSKVGHPAQVQVCGTDGSVFMTDDRFSVWEFRDESAADDQVRARLGARPGAAGAGAADPSSIDLGAHQRNFEDSVAAIRSGGRPRVDGREGRRAVELVNAVYQSALAGGRRVDLPLARTPERRSFATTQAGARPCT